MGPLSDACRERVRAMFTPGEWATAERLLETECGSNLPLMGDDKSAELDRIRFAAVRLSAGQLSSLREAIQLAQTDWRDLLVAADFADDVNAHEEWQPRPLSLEKVNLWKEGHSPTGVDFLLGDSVQITSPLSNGGVGEIASLLALEPEPRYLIELGLGAEIEVYQRWLKRS
jgi:hypothetical protein